MSPCAIDSTSAYYVHGMLGCMFLTMPLSAGAKVGDFNGKTLSTVSGTVLEVDSLDLPGAQARSGLCWSPCSSELWEAALASVLHA